MSLHETAVANLRDWDAPDPGQDALRHAVLAFLLARPDGCQRACVPGHVTASALVVDHTGDRVLLTLHPRFGRWLQLGAGASTSPQGGASGESRRSPGRPNPLFRQTDGITTPTAC